MYCNLCGKKLSTKGILCSDCASKNNSSSNTLQGDGNQNNIVGNNNLFIQNSNSKNEFEANYFREKTKKIPLTKTGVNVTAGLFTIVGFVGFLSNLLQILSWANNVKLPFKINQGFMLFFVLSFIIGISMFILMKILKRQGFTRLSLKQLGGRGINLEIKGNEIYISKIVAVCPQCNSKVTLIDKNNYTIGICHREPQQHTYKFDYTLMEGID